MLVYHQLTTKAWRQILKSKKLWVLGLLASALMPYSLWEYIIYHPQQPWQISLKDLLLQQNNDLYQNLSYWLQQLINTPRLGISALMIGLFLLLMLISFAAQALIIKQAPLKKQTTPDFKEISRQLPVLIITKINKEIK